MKTWSPHPKSAVIMALLIAAGAAHAEPKRYAWITGLKRSAAARYEYLHAHTWPEVNKINKECHIRNFSINEIEIEGKLYLFAHLEYTGKDFDADMKKMAASPVIQRWWKETDPCQIPLPAAAAKHKIWTDMKEVYFLR
jgi:L-rhamnose mutarotase